MACYSSENWKNESWEAKHNFFVRCCSDKLRIEINDGESLVIQEILKNDNSMTYDQMDEEKKKKCKINGEYSKRRTTGLFRKMNTVFKEKEIPLHVNKKNILVIIERLCTEDIPSKKSLENNTDLVEVLKLLCFSHELLTDIFCTQNCEISQICSFKDIFTERLKGKCLQSRLDLFLVNFKNIFRKYDPDNKVLGLYFVNDTLRDDQELLGVLKKNIEENDCNCDKVNNVKGGEAQ